MERNPHWQVPRSTTPYLNRLITDHTQNKAAPDEQSTSTVRVTTGDNRCRQVRQRATLHGLPHHQTASKYGLTPHGATLQ